MFLLVPAYPGCPGSKAVKRSLLSLLLFINFFTPVLNSQGMKKLHYAIQKKYKNQAGMNLIIIITIIIIIL